MEAFDSLLGYAELRTNFERARFCEKIENLLLSLHRMGFDAGGVSLVICLALSMMPIYFTAGSHRN